MVAPPKRRVRLPELAVGVLVTVAFALGAVLWHLNAVDKVPALSVTGPIERARSSTPRISASPTCPPMIRSPGWTKPRRRAWWAA
jgi:hypothetical protein